MPIYEYACAACGHTFEEWQKMSDAPVRTCPKCKKKKVEKLISQTAFQLKGGGWYADLYSSSKPSGKDSAKDSGKDAGKESSGAKDAVTAAGSKGADSRKSADGPGKKDVKGDSQGSQGSKETKKKDTPKKSEARAA